MITHMRSIIIALLLICLWTLHASASLNTNLSLKAGASMSYIEADSTAEYLFAPLSDVEYLISPAAEIQCDFKFGRFLGIAGAMGYSRRGQQTRPAQVEFAGSPYVHEFESTVALSYLSFPVHGFVEYNFGHHWVRLSGGPTLSLLIKDRILWKVDGQDVDAGRYSPDAKTSTSDARLCAGLEYGYRFSSSGLFLGITYGHGMRDIIYGINGMAKTRALTGFLGFRKFFGTQGVQNTAQQ